MKPGEFLCIKLSAEGSRALSEKREDGRENPGNTDIYKNLEGVVAQIALMVEERI